MSLLPQIYVVLVIGLLVIKWWVSFIDSKNKGTFRDQDLWILFLVVIDFVFLTVAIGTSSFMLSPSGPFGGGTVGAFFLIFIGAPLLLLFGATGFLLSVLAIKTRWWIAFAFYILPAAFLVAFLIFSFLQEEWERQALRTQITTPSLTQFVCPNKASLYIAEDKKIWMQHVESRFESTSLVGHLEENSRSFIWAHEFDLSTGGEYVSTIREALQSCENSEGKTLFDTYSEVPYSEPATSS